MNDEPRESNEQIASYQIEKREFFKNDKILQLLISSRTLIFEALTDARKKILEGEATARVLDAKLKEREDFLLTEFKKAHSVE
jgi:hypothetical protein